MAIRRNAKLTPPMYGPIEPVTIQVSPRRSLEVTIQALTYDNGTERAQALSIIRDQRGVMVYFGLCNAFNVGDAPGFLASQMRFAGKAQAARALERYMGAQAVQS